jgi:hypothetical protein
MWNIPLFLVMHSIFKILLFRLTLMLKNLLYNEFELFYPSLSIVFRLTCGPKFGDLFLRPSKIFILRLENRCMQKDSYFWRSRERASQKIPFLRISGTYIPKDSYFWGHWARLVQNIHILKISGTCIQKASYFEDLGHVQFKWFLFLRISSTCNLKVFFGSILGSKACLLDIIMFSEHEY